MATSLFCLRVVKARTRDILSILVVVGLALSVRSLCFLSPVRESFVVKVQYHKLESS